MSVSLRDGCKYTRALCQIQTSHYPKTVFLLFFYLFSAKSLIQQGFKQDIYHGLINLNAYLN